MKFKIVSTSSNPLDLEYYVTLRGNGLNIERENGEVFVIINRVDEFMRIIKVLEEDIIIHDDDIPTIEIYDTWREM